MAADLAPSTTTLELDSDWKEPILDPLDIHMFVTAGLIERPRHGLVKISEGLLLADASIMDCKPLPNTTHLSDDIKFIATHFGSAAYFRCLGFSPEASATLCKHHTKAVERGGEEPSALMTAIHSVADNFACYKGAELCVILEKLGLAGPVQTVILGPSFERLRGSGSLMWWLINLMKKNHRILEGFAERSTDRARCRRLKD